MTFWFKAHIKVFTLFTVPSYNLFKEYFRSNRSMSAKITDSFSVVKKTESVNKKFPQKKFKNEAKVKADQQQKVHPGAKDAIDLGILRDFDLRGEYGPCIGISRLERWSRAENYGLNPPAEVKRIIEQHLNDSKFTECIWYDEELL